MTRDISIVATKTEAAIYGVFPMLAMLLAVRLTRRVTILVFVIVTASVTAISLRAMWQLIRKSELRELPCPVGYEATTMSTGLVLQAGNDRNNTIELTSLVDNNAGKHQYPISGGLLAAMAEAGLATDEIDRVIRDVNAGSAQAAAACDRMFTAIVEQARYSAEAADSSVLLQDAAARVRGCSERQQSAVKQSDHGMDEAARNVATVAASAEILARISEQSAGEACRGR